MLEVRSRLRRKNEEVVAKVLDGEAIIINLATGVYYSLDNTGAAMWEMIEEGWRMEEIATAISMRYDVTAERARQDLLQLGAELLREDIVGIVDTDTLPARQPPVAAMPKLTYSVPALHAYRDMEDLLALDPPSPSLSEIPWKA